MTLGRKVLQLVSCVAIALCWKGPPDSSVKCTHVHLARFWFTGSSLSQGIYLILSRHVERAQVQLWKAQVRVAYHGLRSSQCWKVLIHVGSSSCSPSLN